MTIRDWINRDNGKIFRVGNQNMNYFEVSGYLIAIIGLPLSNVKSMAELKWLGWLLIVTGIFLAFFGNWKKRRQALHNKADAPDTKAVR